jgi:uncharacterized protein
MKKILVLTSILFLNLFFTQFVSALKVEDIKASDYVTDYTNTLTQEQVLEISKILGTIEKEKKYSIAVVVVPTMEDEFGHADYIEHFAVKLYEKLGLGKRGEGVDIQKTDEGMLWLIVKDTHTMRMEVGYGLESILTDGITKNIQDNFVRPEFKNENYYAGIKVGVEKVSEVVNGGELPQTPGGMGGIDWWTIIFFAFVFGVNIFSWLFAIIARTKSWWLGGVAAFFLSAPLFYFLVGTTVVSGGSVLVLTILGLLFDYLISKNYKYWEEKLPICVNGQKWDENHKPAWWAGGTWGPGSGGFSGRGGSGFGGFGGGGMSGGGGSSSSW